MDKTASYAEPGTQLLDHLKTEVEQGKIKVPQFQRDFVWPVEKSAELLDSIIKGYPIGSVIYWRTKEPLKEVRSLGRLHFGESGQEESVNYVLDGQQRLTSILAALFGLKVQLRDGKTRDFRPIVVNLAPVDDEEPIVSVAEGKDCPPNHAYLSDLWEGGYEFMTSLGPELGKRADSYRNRLKNYAIPKVVLQNARLSVATEVFSRLNTGGQKLTVFEIMVAKTYDPTAEFDLVDKWEEFSEELADKHYDSIDATDTLQLIALLLEGECRKTTILDLNKKRFIETWPTAISAIRHAVDFCKDSLRLPVSRLLPYSSMIVPLAYFFTHCPKQKPSPSQASELRNYFWRAGWSQRFSYGTEAKLASDAKAMSKILEGESPEYDWFEPISADVLRNKTFAANGAFTKTIMALLASVGPEKYDSGDKVNLSNDWMHRANSVNFHHVFPKAYLRKQGYEDWQANSVANISLVDDFLNKRSIRARAPSNYMAEFKERNENFISTMKTHLIDVEGSSPIWKDDYDSFLQQRSALIAKELKGRLRPEPSSC